MIMFHRDFGIDLHGRVQGPRQRDIFHDRDVVLGGDFPDLARDQIDALGHADRRRHAAFVGKRDRVMGRVGDDHGGLGNRRHHAFLHARMPQLPQAALDVRIALGLLEFLFHLLQRHFLPLVPLPVLEEIVGDRDHGEHRHHGAQQTQGQLVVTSKIEAGSIRTIDSRRWRSGHSTAAITAPSATSLKMPLAKFAAACLPKIRVAPAAGEILLSFGLSDSPDHTNRCCTMLPAIVASASINSGTPIAPITMYSSLCASASRAGPSTRNIHDLAIRLRSGISIPPPIDPENVDSTRVAPAIMNQVLTSWLLATSPRSWASSRRFWVGSSVLSDVSFSSAIDRLSA